MLKIEMENSISNIDIEPMEDFKGEKDLHTITKIL